MPVEDLPFIASNYYVRRTVVTVDNTAFVQVAPANPSRWHLMILLGGPNAFFITPFPVVLFDTGIRMDSNLRIAEFKFRDTPPLCTQAWFAISAGFVPSDVEVWETIPVGN